MTRHLQVLSLAFLALAGCSNIPEGDDAALDPEVAAIARSGGPRLGRLAVAPISSLGLAADEAAKGWQPGDSPVMDLERVRLEVIRALEATGRFERVRPAGTNALSEAWRERDDFVATIEIENARTTFEGHNTGLWVLNIANWLFWIVPSWFVATEEYSFALDATVTVRSAESGALIERRPVLRGGKPIQVSGDFDELDRGWQFFGFIAPSFDREVWLRIASRLFPAARSALAAGVATSIDGILGPSANAPRLEETRRKALALVVGISRYQDPVQLPPLPFAAADARSVRDALGRCSVAADHATTLLDSGATLAGVRHAFETELSRARDGDTVLLYFAGYGTRTQDGAPALLMTEATAGGDEGRLPFSELASLLAGVKGRKLLVIDAGLGGRGRSVGARGAATTGDDLAAFAADSSLVAILAGEAQDPALEPEHLGAGLLTYHLVSGLDGAADTDKDGHVTAHELFNHVRPRVVAEAALLGERETPRAIGLDHAWSIETPRRAP
jgi:hypothetical protein